jgi:ribosomal protein L11 methyltransferase
MVRVVTEPAAPPRYPYVQITVSPDDSELAALALWELGATGLEERDATTLHKAPPEAAGKSVLIASFATQDDAEAARAELDPGYQPRVLFVEGDAWRHAWRAHFKPTRIGQRLVVRPSWEPYTPLPGDLVLTLDPENAFGTGSHDTTRLVLEALERCVQPGQRLLDVGAGSGILSIAAILHGAAFVRGTEIDLPSVLTAQQNARDNGVGDAVQLDAAPLAEISERFPLVLANIETRILLPLAQQLVARVAPGGLLVLCGVLARERDELLAGYPGLTLERESARGDWLCFELRCPA